MDIEPVDSISDEEEMENYYMNLIADKNAQIRTLESKFIELLPFCVEAYHLLGDAEMIANAIGGTVRDLIGVTFTDWRGRFHGHVKENASPDGDTTDG